MGRSHSSGGGRSGGGGGGFGGGGRSHSSGGSGRSHLGSSGSSFSRHHVSRVPGPSHHHHYHHSGGPHIHTSIHVSGPSGGLIAIIALYVMFFILPMVISFSGVNTTLDEIKTSYYYYQDMIDYANYNPSYKKQGKVVGIYPDSNYEDAWYLKYTVANPNYPYQTYVTEYTFSVFDSEDIQNWEVGDTIWIAVDNPNPPFFDSIDMNYGNVELEDDPEYEYYKERKESLTKTFTIYGIIATSIAGVLLFFVIKAMIKKSKEDKDETSLTLPSTTATVPEKPKTQYCAYCGVALETGSNKCKVCGARNDKA